MPFKAIACFDAVMRTGSISIAAHQLCVTPGAVGQQIRKLEEWLDVALFVRTVRKLNPTPEALQYWKDIHPALQLLDDASAMLRGQQNQEVRLSMPPAFANSWFARRMPELMERSPHIKLYVSASVDQVDLGQGDFDLAVRHFDGKIHGKAIDLLLPDEVRVYCSPGYQEKTGLHSETDMARATLLYTTTHANWSLWFETGDQLEHKPANSLRFDRSELAIDAARRGQGLVLTSPWLVEDDVEQGRLVQLFGRAVSVDKAYYLVRREGVPMRISVADFREWIIQCAHQCELSL